MDASTTDVYRTVDYIGGRWVMDKVPWALVACCVGIFFVVYVDPRPVGPALLRTVAIVAIIAALGVLVMFLLQYLFEGHVAIIRIAAAVILVVIAGVLYWDRPLDLFRRRPAPGFFLGWAFTMGGVGWIVFALLKHFKPTRPIMTLSPAGIAYHKPPLKNLVIPWNEIRAVADLERIGVAGVPAWFSDYTAILISKDFYERHIGVQRTFWSGPEAGWNSMFVPKGELIQMVLFHELFGIAPAISAVPSKPDGKRFTAGHRRSSPRRRAQISFMAPSR